MALAVGGVTSSRKPFGLMTIDARDFGVQADGNDCSAGLQAAVDAAIALAQGHDTINRRVIVHVPSARTNYVLQHPVYLDSDLVGIEGEGQGQTCFAVGQSPQRPGFVLGLPRGSGALRFGLPSGLYGALDSSHRFDLFGKLDNTGASLPNSRWGIRTKLDSLVQVQCGGLITSWPSLRKFTIELCIDSGVGGQAFPGDTQIIGRGNGYAPAPWILTSQGSNQLAFAFRTSDQSGPGNPRRGFGFQLNGVGPFRISLQIDMDLGVAQVYVNGVQVSAINATWPPGLSLFQDDWRPFFMGHSGDSETGGNGFNADIHFYGFLVASGLRYKDLGVGQPQKCVDSVPFLGGSPPNDGFRYAGFARFDTVSGDTLVRFSASESPSSLDRMVTFNEGPGPFDRLLVGYFVNQGAWATGGGGIACNSLKSLTVSGQGFSQLILIGGVLSTSIQDVRAVSGWHGIGSINLGANYPIDLQNCSLSGNDAAYYGYWQIVKAQNIHFEAYNNTIMRLVGCDLSLRDFFAASSSSADTFFKFHSSAYGGGYSLCDGWINTEGERLTGAAIHLEMHPYAQTYLSLKNLQIGSTGNAPAIRIRDTASYSANSGLGYGWMSVDNLTVWSTGDLLDIDGSRCFGEVKGIPSFAGTRLVHQKTFGSDCNIVVFESGFVAPPRTLSWYPGAHLLKNERPVDGQFIEWRCVGEGVYGTSQPPVFVGTNPAQFAQNGLAGYVLNHMYITIGLN